ncbi:mavicyanin-like [Rosa rugosa]|uniref:mavicyanin-like n=1 Tax=Rosa rugosa TaxID=74645 RepID=UPI002B409229|nr:mavicyanin-like [Rosa rugosa]
MALRGSIMFLLVAMNLCGACSGAGAVYKVGGPDGWIVGVDYNQWSSSKEFRVGDGLFFSYNKQYHNVVQVSEQGFKSCNSSSPIAAYSSGSDTITLERPGHYYFLCGAPGHCEDGQKVDVQVSRPIPDNPSPAPSGLSSPSTPHPEERPPHSAALTNAPKLALAVFASVLAWCFLN